MNRLLTILLLAAATTAHGQINNPPTPSSIGLGWSALTNAQSTLYSGQATRLLGYAPEIAASSTNPTGFNVLAYTNTNGLVIPANLLIGEDQTSGGPRNARNVTVNGAVTIQYPYSSPTTIYGNNSILATDASTYTNTLATWNSNTVTFATNVTVGGTLAVTGNVTLSGVNNTATAQTADSASSLMTRGLSDARFYPLASFWLPAEDMESYNSAGTGNIPWTNTAGIVNMVTPFGRSPRTVPTADAALTQGIYTIPTGWPAGSQVRVTTYLALFGGGATTNTFVLQTGGYWTTSTNIIGTVVNAIGSMFDGSSLLTTNVAGTGVTNEYFKISNTFSFATNANVENRQVFVGRTGTSTNDTATNTIYFIGSHVELLP